MGNMSFPTWAEESPNRLNPLEIDAHVDLLASDEARFVTGIDLLVDGGYVL